MNSADHLVNRIIGIDMKQRIHRNGIPFANPPQIVAHHIGNHEILRQILRVRRQILRNFTGPFRDRGTLCSPFHRGAGHMPPVRRFQIQFRRQGKNLQPA